MTDGDQGDGDRGDGDRGDGGVQGRAAALATRAKALARGSFERLPSGVKRVLSRLIDRDVLLAASSLAFYGLISIMPLLLISFSLVEFLAGESELRRLENAATSPQTGSVGILVRDLIRGASSSWIVILGTLWPATAYGAGLARALRHMGDRDAQVSGRGGRFKGLAFVFVLPVLVLLGVPGAFVLTRLPGTGVLQTMLGWAAAAVVGSLTTAAVVVFVYRAFAPESLTWPATVKGAAATAAGLTALSIGAVLVLGLGVTSNRYGTPAVTAVLLMGVWLFAANIVLLAGYQTVLALEADADDEPAPPPGIQ